MTEIQKIWDRKAQARMAEISKLERGEITRDELQAKCSLIPMELAADPEWKAACLAAAVASMNKPRPKMSLPAGLLHYSGIHGKTDEPA